MADAFKIQERVEVLLVEDNPGDVRLAREALKSTRLWSNLNVVRDGMEAMSYLRREGPFSRTVRPDLILLDLNLPRKSGREVLAEVKGDDDFKLIPILILSGSNAEQDRADAVRFHADGYMTKPLDRNQFKRMAGLIEDFWFAVARPPE